MTPTPTPALWPCLSLQTGSTSYQIRQLTSVYRIVQQKIGRPSQKLVVLLHSIFKLLAFFVYMTASIISSSFIACFILVMLLLSADFWVVKNVSGRLLAGLRWWSVVDEEGKVVWRYESWSEEERSLAQRGEGTYFWWSTIMQQVVWTLLAVVSVFR